MAPGTGTGEGAAGGTEHGGQDNEADATRKMQHARRKAQGARQAAGEAVGWRGRAWAWAWARAVA
jgi:hypothetical protein